MRKISTILFAVLFSTAALAAHVPGHKNVVPVPPKKSSVYDGKKWLPPLEIQNKKN